MFTANVEAPNSAGLQFSGLIMLRHAFRLCSSRIVRPEHVYGVGSMVATIPLTRIHKQFKLKKMARKPVCQIHFSRDNSYWKKLYMLRYF